MKRKLAKETGLLKAAKICASIRDGRTDFAAGSATDMGIRLGANLCLRKILTEVRLLPHDELAIMEWAAETKEAAKLSARKDKIKATPIRSSR